MINIKKASASMGGSLGGLIGLIVGTLLPAPDGASLIGRVTGAAIMGGTGFLINLLYLGIVVLICGAIGAMLGSLAE